MTNDKSPQFTGQLRQAAILILAGLLLVALILPAIEQTIIQPAFNVLERQQALEDNNRALAAIEKEVNDINHLANDWAYWDDAYAFTQNSDPAFVKSNYPDAAFLSQYSGADVLAIFDKKGRCLIRGAFHPSMYREVQLNLLNGGPVPPIVKILSPVMENDTPVNGFVTTEHGLLLLVARPILTTAKKGPSQGVILMGRFITQTVVQHLSERIKVEITLLQKQNPAVTPFERELFERQPVAIPDTKPVLREGFVDRMLFDMDNRPLALLRTAWRGDITALGKRTGRILSVLLGSIAFVSLFGLAVYRYFMKISEIALQESEARYRQLFEAESDAIFLVDHETGNILEANIAAVNLYGYSLEELLTGKNTDLSAEPEKTERFSFETPVVFDHVSTIPLRLHKKKNGTIFPVEITTRFFIHQGRPVQIGAVRDITERKKTEDSLRFTQFAVDCSADGAFWMNDEGRFVYVNREGCRSLGYTMEELQGMTIADIDPEFPFDTWKAYWIELKRQKNKLLESIHKTKDGRTFPIEVRANYVEFEGKEYNCAIVRDISKRKRLEKERADLEALNWQLQKEESLGRMAGAFAHHFNNQLMAIMGFIQLAMDRQQAIGQETIPYLLRAMEASHNAAKLSGLMLTYLGKITGDRLPMDLCGVCRQYLPMLEAMIPGKIVLRTDFQSPGPIVTVTIEHVQQILTNLTTNSVDAIGDHSGWIELGVNIMPPADIPAANRFPAGWQPQDAPHACLTVADNGCGTASDDIEKLFDPFFTSKFTGRGLGLPVVLGLIKAHGGGITVESELGKGSRFLVFFPLQQV